MYIIKTGGYSFMLYKNKSKFRKKMFKKNLCKKYKKRVRGLVFPDEWLRTESALHLVLNITRTVRNRRKKKKLNKGVEGLRVVKIGGDVS